MPRGKRLFYGASCLLTLCAWLFVCCGSDPLAGGSTGVDNPQLAFSFHDNNGMNTRVSGTLSLYLEDQNPVTNPAPITQKYIDNRASISFSAYELQGIDQSLVKKSAITAADSLIRFNAVLHTESNTGDVIFHIRYHKIKKEFEDSSGSQVGKLKIQTKALRNISLTLNRSQIEAGSVHVYIPGTPFQTQSTGNTFILTTVPMGKYKARVLSPNGSIYLFSKVLDTEKNVVYDLTDTNGIPIDTTYQSGANRAPQVNAGRDTTIQITDSSFTLSGLILDDTLPIPHQITYQWQQLSGPRSALMIPNVLNTPVTFPVTGTYAFVLVANDGSLSAADTVIVTVGSTQSAFTIIRPQPFDSAFTNSIFNIIWTYPSAVSVRMDFSIDSGNTWRFIDTTVSVPGSQNSFPWNIPSDSTIVSNSCRLRLTTMDGNNISTISNGSFFIKP